MTIMCKLGAVVMVAISLVLAGCTSSAVPTTSSTSTSTTTHPTSTTEPISTAAACTASQVTVGGFGSSGAAGTGVSTIRIENTSSSPCSLRGYPVVTFLGNASSRFDPAAYPAHVLRVAVGHTSFFGDVSRVVLPPGQAASAGFVITNYDNEGGTTCPTATSIRVKLPDMTQSFTVGVAVQVIGILLCAPSAACVSPIVKGAVLAVSPENPVATNAQPTDPHITPTAVTGAAGDLWMLGTYACSTGTCPVLMRSTDGGRSWVRVGSPPSSVDAIDFANRQDGYAYFQGSYGERATLYWTGNGGRTWRLVPLRFPESRSPSIVIASGRAYLLVPENCLANGECRSQALASSAVTSDVWTTKPLRLPVGEAIQPVGLAAFRSKVWVIGTNASAVLSVSSNGGRSFANLSSTGLEGLACDATATSASVLWAFCATGSLGYAARSTDGGREFALMPGWNHGYKGDASNAGSIIPLSDNEAVFRSGGPYFYLTRDGGREFSSIWSHNDWNRLYSIAFADTTSWVMLGVSEGPGGNNPLWRTTNAGRSWQSVKAPTVTAPTTVSSADLSRFVALAHKGLREPFEATYRFVPPLDSSTGPIPSFAVWSEPMVGSDSEGNFVYEAPFGSATFRFIKDGRGKYYECLRAASRKPWRCVGPFASLSVGESMWVEGYRMPMFVTENLSTNLTGRLSHRTILGRRLWCLNVQPEGFLCLTKTGQLAFDAKWFVGSSQLELASLALAESRSAFLLRNYSGVSFVR